MNPNAGAFFSSSSTSSDDDEVVLTLASMFPGWNRKHLHTYWVNSGRDWDSCLREITLIESELGAGPSPSPSPAVAKVVRPQATPVWSPSPVARAEEFPTLGSDDSARTSSAANSWASKAKQNLGAPAPSQPRRTPPGFHRTGVASTHETAPQKPIWESGVQQVSTGGAVSAQYAGAREDARTMAIARNTLFEEATRAFQRGDKKLAKELGARGRELNETMHALHSAAAQGIFESRNAGIQSSGGRRVVDCHGLHAKEGVSRVMEILDRARRLGEEREIDVVVGTGSHSKTNSGVLRRAIVEAVETAGYRFRENYAGMLTVYL